MVSESLSDKTWRLKQIRSQLESFKNYPFTAPDEVDNLLYLMREWAELDDCGFAESKLKEQAENSLFPPLIKFCKDELSGIVNFCNNHLPNEDGLSPACIETIKKLSLAEDLKAVEQFSVWLDDVYIVNLLARIMCTSYGAIKNPGILDDLCILKFRGDLLEVIACTYADINKVMCKEAAKGFNQQVTQVKSTNKPPVSD